MGFNFIITFGQVHKQHLHHISNKFKRLVRVTYWHLQVFSNYLYLYQTRIPYNKKTGHSYSKYRILSILKNNSFFIKHMSYKSLNSVHYLILTRMVYLHSANVFQSLMVLSRLPDTIWRLSAEKATLNTS